MKYTAKDDYQTEQTARGYEQRSMYSGFIGRRRVRIEQNAIADLVAGMPSDAVVLDCPCGNGRWFSSLARKASRIVARDISIGMTTVARERVDGLSIPVDISICDAEKLDLADGSVDVVFSYALMKHLPLPMQYRVLAEFARVSRRQVVCSFAVLNHVSYEFWRRRRQNDSFPVLSEEIEFMAKQAGLTLDRLVKVSQPFVGLESFAVFAKQ